MTDATSPADLPALAEDLEEAVRSFEVSADSDLGGHALALYRLANTRLKLGNWEAAADHAERSAELWWNDGQPIDAEGSAAARILQAGALSASNKPSEAAAVFETLVAQFDGLPVITWKNVLSSGIALWMEILHDAGDWQRQYEVTGLALARLDPSGSDNYDRLVRLETQVGRAIAAYHLECYQEARVLLEAALLTLERENPTAVDRLKAIALLQLVDVLYELDADDEATAASRRVIDTYGQRTEEWAKLCVASAKRWLDDDEDEV